MVDPILTTFDWVSELPRGYVRFLSRSSARPIGASFKLIRDEAGRVRRLIIQGQGATWVSPERDVTPGAVEYLSPNVAW